MERPLLWILGLAAAVRLGLFWVLRDIEPRTDELQYQEIAVNLLQGLGFSLDGQLTSWRPPLYPFAMSVLYRLTGTTDPAVIRAAQALLSLGTVVLVHALARRVFGTTVARVAAAVLAFYPPLLFFNNHLVAETLFIFLATLAAYAFVEYLAAPRLGVLAASGLALGLAVLTRDIVWPTVGIMAVLIAWWHRPPIGRWVLHSAVLVAALLAVTAPWVVRNTRVQGTFTLIATNGGMVFLAGNYEHTPADRPWRAHALPPELKVRRLFSPELSEGEAQRQAVKRALAYIREHPGLTARNALIRAANVWGLERSIVGAALAGVYGAPPRGAILGLSLSIFAAEAVTLLAGLAGLCFALARHRAGLGCHVYVAALAVFTTLAHAPVSGHPRYHLPLIPLLAIYAAHAWSIRAALWPARHTTAFKVAVAGTGLLAAVWVREVLFVELSRFLHALDIL